MGEGREETKTVDHHKWSAEKIWTLFILFVLLLIKKEQYLRNPYNYEI